MRRLAILAAAIVGLGFPAGLGLAVYLASGSSLAPPATARVPTGTIGEPSTLPVPTLSTDDSTTTEETTTDETTTEGTTTDETTTEAETTTEDSSGKGRGRGRGRGRGGDD